MQTELRPLPRFKQGHNIGTMSIKNQTYTFITLIIFCIYVYLLGILVLKSVLHEIGQIKLTFKLERI